jgi:hypothetical protein
MAGCRHTPALDHIEILRNSHEARRNALLALATVDEESKQAHVDVLTEACVLFADALELCGLKLGQIAACDETQWASDVLLQLPIHGKTSPLRQLGLVSP